MSMLSADVGIVGAGPAGVATAVQLKRAGITSLLFERDQVGGLLRNANLVENYPGFPQGIVGTALTRKLVEHLKHWSISVVHEKVQWLDFEDDGFRISTDEEVYRTRFVIVASGTQPIHPSEIIVYEEARDRVHYDIVRLLDCADQELVIIGGGDAAFDYALNLSRRNRVTLLIRGDCARCLPLLEERSRYIEAISTRFGMAVEAIAGDEERLSVRCTDGKAVMADEVTIAVGREPCLDFLGKSLLRAKESLIKDKRLLLIGDVVNDRYRQASIAVGDGVKAAMQIASILTEDEDENRRTNP